MEVVIVWTMLYWNSALMAPGGDLTVMRASIGYFHTEEECWAGGKGTLGTLRGIAFTCAKTMTTQDELARKDADAAKTVRSLQELQDRIEASKRTGTKAP